LEVTIDRQGRIVIPKKVRKKYGLSEEGRLELVTREDVIELIPLVEEGDLTVLSLKQPCETGDTKAHDKAFSREKAWTR
jgi:AbrB family looped-hinge helix DNA binding protein